MQQLTGGLTIKQVLQAISVLVIDFKDFALHTKHHELSFNRELMNKIKEFFSLFAALRREFHNVKSYIAI
ncbi:MAG: hypothetical protein V4495_05445 [Pseudomonadota bacterium]